MIKVILRGYLHLVGHCGSTVKLLLTGSSSLGEEGIDVFVRQSQYSTISNFVGSRESVVVAGVLELDRYDGHYVLVQSINDLGVGV